MKNKLIVIEGTDCSGKETQSNLLIEKLHNTGINAMKMCFPMYNTPTGKIVGGPYLGKEYICSSWFPETAANVDAIAASYYYAADRRYNKNKIDEMLNNGATVVLDRYVESNMAHQGGKIKDVDQRHKMYEKLEILEYEISELKKPDLIIFLYMPYEYALKLRQGREEKADGHESSKEHLVAAEKS